MTDADALLAAVAAAPDDDVPRLVLADWLEEHGDPDRAEFIRLQCELARADVFSPDRDRMTAREAALLDRHRVEWAAPVERALGGYTNAAGVRTRWEWPPSTVFRRGFVRHLTLELPALLGAGARLFAQVPTARSVHVRLFRGRAAELAACPALSHLTELTLGGQEGLTAAEFRDVVASPHLAGLRHLHVPNEPVGDEGVVSLCASPVLAGLRALRVPGFGLGAAGARALAGSPHLTRLERLGLWHDRVGPEAGAALLGSPNLTRMTDLSLERCGVGDDGAAALARSPYARGLRRLVLSEDAVTDAGVEALAGSPNAARLRVLDLRSNRFGVAGVRALAESPYLSGLRALDLSGNEVGAVGAAALVLSPHLGGLTRLCLRGASLPGPALAGVWDRFRDRAVL